MTISAHDVNMDPPSPITQHWPVEVPDAGTPDKPDAPPAKKQLSSAQKASLARAREKARQSKLAKSQAKAVQEKEFAKFQKGPSPVKEAVDEEMTESEPSPSPVKKKKSKRHAKKKRRHYTTSESDTSEEDPADAKQRLADHATLAKQVYQNNLSRYKSDVVYKSLFPYLQGN